MSNNIALNHLPLRPSSLATLHQRGFVTSGDLEHSKTAGGISNLAGELGVSLPEAARILREVQGAIKSITFGSTENANVDVATDSMPITGGRTAKDILQASSSASSQQNGPIKSKNRTIVTFCRSIDQLLGGGIGLGEVTEVVGLPGVGKTQLGMQLCIDARLPQAYGGVAGEAIYIDTEGSFSPERCFTMAQNFVDHVQLSASRRQGHRQSTASLPDWFVPEKILDGIHVYRVHDEAAQTATIISLENFIKTRAKEQAQGISPVRLVVIDSIAFHYRCAPEGWDYLERTRSLTSLAACLADLANKFDIAVVVINQMTTKFAPSANASGRQVPQLVPALGESWAHSVTTRLLLSHDTRNNSIPAGARICTLVKSPHKPQGTAYYQVLECGIRDVSITNAPQQENISRVRTSVTPTSTSVSLSTGASSYKRIRTQYS